MAIQVQSAASSTQIAGTRELAASVAAQLRVAMDATSEPTAIISAIRLLTEAGQALVDSKDDARKYILRAAAILQAESDCRGHEPSTAAGTAAGTLAPWQLKRVMRFIDANLAEKIGPQDFASLTRLSTSHFARAFRTTVGEAPHAFLVRRRIEHAKELMLETSRPLAHIALDCGLADQAHMTRLFSRMVGISPGAWRRAHVAAIDDSSSEEADQSHRLTRKVAFAAPSAHRAEGPVDHAFRDAA